MDNKKVAQELLDIAKSLTAKEVTAKGDINKVLKLLNVSKKTISSAIKGTSHFFPGTKEAELALAEMRNVSFDDEGTQREWNKKIEESQKKLNAISDLWFPMHRNLKEEIFDIENLQNIANFIKLQAK
jgi:hypothetical protein